MNKLLKSMMICMMTLCVVCNTYAQVNSIESRRPILTPTPGEFPIVASTVFNDNVGPQKEGLADIKDCGFNLCMHSTSVDRFETLLRYMDGTGLKLLLHNSAFRVNPKDRGEKWKSNVTSFVNKFRDNPNVAGWELYDEPKWNLLEEISDRYKWLKKNDDSHFVLVNLVGQIAKDFTGPCGTLEEYLDSIQNKFDMDVWSSDYYPILIRGGKFLVQYKYLYDDLKAFSERSKQTGKPMWAYCESMAYTAKNYSRPAATLAYLSFEAFSALAYGAQGLVYWTYWQRPSTSYETYHSALVDLDGNKTPAWYAARDVNFQIRAFTPVFLGAKMVECRHTGKIAMKDALPYISEFGPIAELSNGEKGVLVSLLKNGTHDYIMIVNHDVENKQKVKIKFEEGVVAERLTPASGAIKRASVKKTQNISLQPGGYAVFEWVQSQRR